MQNGWAWNPSDRPAKPGSTGGTRATAQCASDVLQHSPAQIRQAMQMLAAIWRLTAWLALDLYTGHVIAGVHVVKCCPVQMCSSDSTAMVAEVHRNSLFSLVSDCLTVLCLHQLNWPTLKPPHLSHSIFRRAMASVSYDPP